MDKQWLEIMKDSGRNSVQKNHPERHVIAGKMAERNHKLLTGGEEETRGEVVQNH